MPKILRPYALATISVTLALFLTLVIPPLHHQVKFLLFIIAVVVSANEGIRSGLFATVLSAVLTCCFLIPPTSWSSASDLGYLARLFQFCGLSLAITYVTHRFQHSDEAIRTAAAVVESLADSVIRQGLDNTIQSWNKAAERIYGYTAQEAIGRPASLIASVDCGDELQQLIERVHLGGVIQSHETERIRKGGTRINVALTLSPVKDQKGRIVGVSSLARQITAGRQADETIRQSHAKLEQQTGQLKILAEMSEMLQASSTPGDAYSVIARFASRLVPTCSGALFVSSSRNYLEVGLRWGEPQPGESDFFDADECWGLRTGQMHLAEDPHTALLCRHLTSSPSAPHVCAPMIAHGETLGLLHLQMSPSIESHQRLSCSRCWT